MSRPVYFSSLILKLPDVINLLASEFDFVRPFSVKTLGKCTSPVLSMVNCCISLGAFLLIVIFSNEVSAIFASWSL